jgi:lipoprotein-anchoring transpeptidase ErfK/SrfK
MIFFLLTASAIASDACASIGGRCSNSCSGTLLSGLCAGAPTCCVQQSDFVHIDVATNSAALYKDRTLVKRWNVATAKAGKVTPAGVYAVYSKTICQDYMDRGVGGCSPSALARNPLGPRAIWFNGEIGMHGTTQPEILDYSVEARRVSNGCVRNKNDQILWLFDKVQVGTPVLVSP